MRAWARILPPAIAFVAGALLLEFGVRWSGIKPFLPAHFTIACTPPSSLFTVSA